MHKLKTQTTNTHKTKKKTANDKEQLFTPPPIRGHGPNILLPQTEILDRVNFFDRGIPTTADSPQFSLLQTHIIYAPYS